MTKNVCRQNWSRGERTFSSEAPSSYVECIDHLMNSFHIIGMVISANKFFGVLWRSELMRSRGARAFSTVYWLNACVYV
jgi:hypothetical protein